MIGSVLIQTSLCSPVQVLCCLVEPVSAVIQSLSSSALTDLLQELQGGDGQLAGVLQNKVNHQQTVAGWVISQPGRTCVRSPAKEESLLFLMLEMSSLHMILSRCHTLQI